MVSYVSDTLQWLWLSDDFCKPLLRSYRYHTGLIFFFSTITGLCKSIHYHSEQKCLWTGKILKRCKHAGTTYSTSASILWLTAVTTAHTVTNSIVAFAVPELSQLMLKTGNITSIVSLYPCPCVTLKMGQCSSSSTNVCHV